MVVDSYLIFYIALSLYIIFLLSVDVIRFSYFSVKKVAAHFAADPSYSNFEHSQWN